MITEGTSLYSVLLEVRTQEEALLPLMTGPQIHAMFLRRLTQDDLALFAQLHDQPGVRPFTLSQLLGAEIQHDHLRIFPGQTYLIRVTLLDDGRLWERLSTLLLETGPILIQLDRAPLSLTRLFVNPTSDRTGWVAKTSWKILSEVPPRQMLSLRFASPTAFNIAGKYYELFPEPLLVWKSLLRTWNTYAPEQLKMEKQELYPSIQQQVRVVACDHLATHTMPYLKYAQKGFTGICSYEIDSDPDVIQKLTTLAEFARYAGVGYKTTWGMGQARLV
jgi:CRISPR-associated endoribonuclease Cas6